MSYITPSTKFKELWNEHMMMKSKAKSIQSLELTWKDILKFTIQYFDFTNFMGEWRCWPFYYQPYGQRTWSLGQAKRGGCTQYMQILQFKHVSLDISFWIYLIRCILIPLLKEALETTGILVLFVPCLHWMDHNSEMYSSCPSLHSAKPVREVYKNCVGFKHRHRRNVTSHHSFSLLWQS